MNALSAPVDVTAAAAQAAAGTVPTMHATTEAKALKTGRAFEAMFMSEMMQQMFAGVSTGGWFGGGQAEEMFRPLLIDQYGKLIANHGNGIGIAQAVARTLLQAQEAHR